MKAKSLFKSFNDHLKNGGDNVSNRLKYTCLCKHIIKGGLRMVGAVKRGHELFTKRVFLLLKQG